MPRLMPVTLFVLATTLESSKIARIHFKSSFSFRLENP